MRFRLVLFSTLMLAMLSACAPLGTQQDSGTGVTAERPVFEPGYRLTFVSLTMFSSGRRMSYVYQGQRDGLHVFKMRNLSDEEYLLSFTPDLALVRNEGQVEFENRPSSAPIQFPLYVGKRWRHHYNTFSSGSSISSTTANISVAAYEQVTVPAGTFWAFRIKASSLKRRSLLELPEAWQETYWYAPEVGFWVKYLSEWGIKRDFGEHFELASYGQ